MESMVIIDNENGNGIENLSLDEIIAINKLRNQISEDETRSVKSHKSKKDFVDKVDVESRLRSIPGFGTKPVHHRLGYGGFKKRTIYNGNPMRALAQRSLYKARFAKWGRGQRQPLNPLITFTNPDALKSHHISPLTRNSILKFNRMNNSGFMSKGLPSTRSVISNRPTCIRHSAQKCLNMSIQQEIKDMSFTAEGVDPESLEQFIPTPESTKIPTHLRFSSYV